MLSKARYVPKHFPGNKSRRLIFLLPVPSARCWQCLRVIQQDFSQKQHRFLPSTPHKDGRSQGCAWLCPIAPGSTGQPTRHWGNRPARYFWGGTMRACRWVSMNTQGGVPVEEAVTQGWPISMGARGSLRLSSVMVVLRQPGSPTTVRTSCVWAPGSCAPLVGQGKPLPCLPHQLLPPSPVAFLSACVTSGTPDRAHSSASHCRIVGPFL